jgi:apolipoprotein D and lipocalin family protein
MDCVEARYSLNQTDGSLVVDNRGKVLNTGVRTIDIGRAVLAFPEEDPLRGKL